MFANLANLPCLSSAAVHKLLLYVCLHRSMAARRTLEAPDFLWLPPTGFNFANWAARGGKSNGRRGDVQRVPDVRRAATALVLWCA